MTDTIRDLIELAQRLEHGRSLPPTPLIRRGNPARDGPKRSPDTLRRNEVHHGPHSAPQRQSGQFRGVWQIKFGGN
jgi:hypothetical protein